MISFSAQKMIAWLSEADWRWETIGLAKFLFKNGECVCCDVDFVRAVRRVMEKEQARRKSANNGAKQRP